MKINNVKYFDSYELEYISKEIKKFIGNTDIVIYLYRVQAYLLLLSGYFCIGRISLNTTEKV